MKIRQNQLSTILSLILLSISMFVWVDLFAFSKSIHLPLWTKILPIPIMAAGQLAFICLIPAAFFTETLGSACRAVTITISLSPFSGLTAYALNPLHQGHYLIGNILFNYFYMVLMWCIVPAIFFNSDPCICLLAPQGKKRLTSR